VDAIAPIESAAVRAGEVLAILVADFPTRICANPKATEEESLVTGPERAIIILLCCFRLCSGFHCWIETLVEYAQTENNSEHYCAGMFFSNNALIWNREFPYQQPVHLLRFSAQT
jgi:hypothetical protein